MVDAVVPDTVAVVADKIAVDVKETATAKPPAKQAKILKWLINNKDDVTGRLYFYRVMYESSSPSGQNIPLSIDNLLLVLPAELSVARATLARLVKGVRDGEYDEYVSEIASQNNVPLSLLYPQKAVMTDGAIRLKNNKK